MQHELRLARRGLARSPYFCAAAIACAALGIGLCTAVFSVVNAYLLRPLPFDGGDHMVVLAAERPGRRSLTNMSYPNYQDVRDRSRVFDGIVGYAPINVGLTANGVSDRIWGQTVSGNYFVFLGVQPLTGRTITPADDVPSQSPVAVISHGLWQRRFGGDSAIVGKIIRLNASPFTIVGVTRKGFRGTDALLYADVWIPMTVGEVAGGPQLSFRRGNVVRVLGRLRPGVTLAQARSDVGAIAAVLREESPDDNRGVALRVLREQDARPDVSASGQMMPVALFLMAVAGTLLAICCANVISLTLARATARQLEASIQLAIGATRWSLLRQYLFESVLVVSAGGLVAMLIARAITAWLSNLQIADDRPLYLDFRPDARVFLFCLLVSLTAGIVVGAVAALKTSHATLSTALSEARSSVSRRRTRLQSAIVTGQFAMLTILLALGGLFVRSVVAANRMDLGFRSEATLLLTVDPTERGYDDVRGRQLTSELMARIATLPGVRAVAIAENVPFGPSSSSMEITAPDRAPEPSPVSASYSVVGGDYFTLLGISIVRGRAFDDRDRANSPSVAIINERLAHTLWPGADPLNRRIAGPSQPQAPTNWYQVIGVTKTGKYNAINEAPRDYLYLPYAQLYRPRMTFHVKTDAALETALPQIRQQLADLDPDLAFFDVTTLDDRVTSAKGPVAVGALLAGGFGLLGALLAGVGLYGLISYVVTLRARELAIRIGLGAEPRAITTLCLSRAIRLAGLGAGIGLLLALGIVQPIQSVLVGVRTLDPITATAVFSLIQAIALAASYLPVRRLLAAPLVRMLLRE